MFFKSKKEKAPKIEKQAPVIEITIEQLQELEATLETSENKVSVLLELGSGYEKLEKTDKAIFYYETAIENGCGMGKASTGLMKLYNVKRREASENKDQDQIEFYMAKINGIMQMSKDTLRGNV